MQRCYVEKDNDNTSPDAFNASSKQIALTTRSFTNAQVQIEEMIDMVCAEDQEATKYNSCTGLNKDQRIARDNAEYDDDEHAVNFIEKTTPTEYSIQHVATVPAQVHATARWHNMWIEDLGPDYWREIGYSSLNECIEEFSARSGIDTSTGKPKYSAKQIWLDLDLFLAKYMSNAMYNVDEFGISANLKEYVENVESKTSSKLVPYSQQTLQMHMRSL